MARLPRFDLAGVPRHVVQRGNNRLPCFLDDEDRQRYLQCLRPALLRFGCRLHACVLTSNHVHLLLTPDGTGGVSRMMPTFARNHAGSFNGRHGRTGTLWEGRFKACLVDPGAIFRAVVVASNSIRFVPGWWRSPESIRGQVMVRTRRVGCTRCLRRIESSSALVPTRRTARHAAVNLMDRALTCLSCPGCRSMQAPF